MCGAREKEACVLRNATAVLSVQNMHEQRQSAAGGGLQAVWAAASGWAMETVRRRCRGRGSSRRLASYASAHSGVRWGVSGFQKRMR
jgi:hypothetical protein